MANNLDLVSINNSLALDVKKQEIKTKIINRINELGLTISNYRGNTELILLCANLVEHLVDKKKFKKLDKKEMVIDVLNTLFNLTPQEKMALDANIEFLHSNKNIKKVSGFKLFCVGVKEYFGFTKK